MPDTLTTCPTCGEPVLSEDRFCEACGTDLPANAVAAAEPEAGADGPLLAAGEEELPPPAPCTEPDCAGSYVAGWCDTCGTKQPDPRDHLEFDAGAIGAVTDRGQRHHRNEDAVAIRDLGAGVLVATVCDGVSSTVSPQTASQRAVDASTAALSAQPDDLAAAYDAAAAAAAGVEARPHADLGAPSCTYLAVSLVPGRVAIAALGDCRAYWVADDRQVRQLSHDDSWAQHAIDEGMDPAAAHADPRAHVITRWLGADADPTWRPGEVTLGITAPGYVLACSDGLWNYLDGLAAVAKLVHGIVETLQGGARPRPVAIARALVAFANAAGGHDNITAVVIRATPGTHDDPDEPGEAAHT